LFEKSVTREVYVVVIEYAMTERNEFKIINIGKSEMVIGNNKIMYK
jgi:hypothetical protein